MPMFETETPCPICRKPLTDVDGMLECQNDPTDWHFTYIDGNGLSHFNFEAWSKMTFGSKR